MTVCTIVLTVVSCMIDPATKVSPTEAVKLMTHSFVYVPTIDTGEARVTIMPDATTQPYVPPTYPLTPGSYTPFYPYPFPYLYPGLADGFGLSGFSQGVMMRDRVDHKDATAPAAAPSVPAAPATTAPAQRGSVPLGRLGIR